MKVTNVKIFLKDGERLKAFANIVLDDCFIIRGLRVLEGPKGFYVAMPTVKDSKGTFVEQVHPLNNDTRIMIENIVLDQYEIVINEN